MRPTHEALKKELLAALRTAQDRLEASVSTEELLEVAELVAGLPGLLKAQMLQPGDLQGVQDRMARAEERLSKVKRPSYSTLPPAAASFRRAGDQVSNNPIMKGK